MASGSSLPNLRFWTLRRVIAEDLNHSGGEQRYFCFGRIERRYYDGPFHVAEPEDHGLSGGLLAQGKDDL